MPEFDRQLKSRMHDLELQGIIKKDYPKQAIEDKTEEVLFIDGVSDSFFALYPYSGKAHFGKSKTKTFCGRTVDDGMNEPLRAKIEDSELMELWNENSKIQKPKWVKTTKYDKCKRCMKALKKNYH